METQFGKTNQVKRLSRVSLRKCRQIDRRHLGSRDWALSFACLVAGRVIGIKNPPVNQTRPYHFSRQSILSLVGGLTIIDSVISVDLKPCI